MTEQTKLCKHCQTEISKKAKVCPNCKKDQRNWFSKHPILSIIWIFIILWVISGLSNNQQNSGELVTIGTDNSSNKVVDFKIWDEVKVWNFNYKITKVENKQTVWNEFYSKKANWVFKILYIEATNNSNEPKTLDSNLFKLLDDSWKSFSYSIEWNSALATTQKDHKDFFLTQMQPWLKVSWTIIFDIPQDSKWLKLEVTGWYWSAEKAYIEIN